MRGSAETGSGGDAGRLSASLRTLFDVGTLSGRTDGQLLECFVRGRGDATSEAAFTAIVERHGSMVLGVCRSILGDRHDAEDACQAVFLVLAERPGSIRRGEALAGWLYGVAGRIARRARRDLARRRELERRRLERAGPSEPVAPMPAEPRPEIYEELDGLPEPFRAAVILCDLEGHSYERAAGLIGCPVGTLQSRLARGRERLRRRLERRGIAPAVIGVLNPAGALPPRLTAAIARAAVEVIGGGTIAGTAPAAVAILAGAEVRRQVMRRLAMTLTMLVAAGGIATAAFVLAVGGTGDEPGRRAPAAASKAETEPLCVRVVDVEGKGVPGIAVEVHNGDRPGSVATDSDGRAAIPRVLVGEGGFLIARRGGEALAWGSPNDPRPDRPAGTVDDPIVMTLLPTGHRVEGSMVDPSGRPIAGVRVRASALAHPVVNGSVIFRSETPDDWLGPAVTDRAGRFAMRLPSGARVSLRVWHPRYFGPSIEVMPDAGAVGPTTLKPAGGIAGRVIDAATGRPIAGAVVGARLTEHRTRFVVDGGGRGGNTTSDDRGRFVLGGLEPGVYNLLFRKAPGRPDATARAVECLRVRAGADTTADLAVVEGRAIRGFVVDRDTDEPVPGAVVCCDGPARPRGGDVQTTKTDDRGRFTFSVPPGEQRVYCRTRYGNYRLDRRNVLVPEQGEIEPVRLVVKAPGPPMSAAPNMMVTKAAVPPGPPTKVAGPPNDDADQEADVDVTRATGPVRGEPAIAKAAVRPAEFTKESRPTAVEAPGEARAPAAAPEVRTVTGHVRDPQGRPLAGVQIDSTVWNIGDATTDREGLFVFPDLPRRPLRINLTRAGYRTQAVDLPADRDQAEWTFGLVPDPNDRNVTPTPTRDEPVPAELRRRLTFVDLQRRGNDYLDDGPGYTGNDLSSLPRGVHKLGETYFRIGEKMVHVLGQTWNDMPRSVKGIEVRGRGAVLHFLHAVQYGSDALDLVGAYTIHYADGTSEGIPLVCGRNLNDWWSSSVMPRGATGAKVAWTGSNESTGTGSVRLQLFDMAWTNPHPEKEIVSLDVLSAGKQPDPFLVALTLERDR